MVKGSFTNTKIKEQKLHLTINKIKREINIKVYKNRK